MVEVSPEARTQVRASGDTSCGAESLLPNTRRIRLQAIWSVSFPVFTETGAGGPVIHAGEECALLSIDTIAQRC